MMFDAMSPGSRWKAFLPRAALIESQAALDCSGASAVVARRWSGRASQDRGAQCLYRLRAVAVGTYSCGG
jgi:hypothetical protein